MGNWYMWWLWLLSSSQSRDMCIISLDFGLQCPEVSQGHILGSLEGVCLDCCLWRARTRREKCMSPRVSQMYASVYIWLCGNAHVYARSKDICEHCCAHMWLFWAYTCMCVCVRLQGHACYGMFVAVREHCQFPLSTLFEIQPLVIWGCVCQASWSTCS